MAGEVRRTEKDGHCMISLTCGPKNAQLIETEGRMWLPGVGGGVGRGGEMLIKGTNFQLDE